MLKNTTHNSPEQCKWQINRLLIQCLINKHCLKMQHITQMRKDKKKIMNQYIEYQINKYY